MPWKIRHTCDSAREKGTRGKAREEAKKKGDGAGGWNTRKTAGAARCQIREVGIVGHRYAKWPVFTLVFRQSHSAHLLVL